MKGRGKQAFVLLEVLPALLLLMGALIISARMLALATETRLKGQSMPLLHEAIQPVWKAWEEQGGTAAIASFDNDNNWIIRTFPDSSWLPDTASDRPQRQHVLIRVRTSDPSGWEIRTLVGASRQNRSMISLMSKLDYNEDPSR